MRHLPAKAESFAWHRTTLVIRRRMFKVRYILLVKCKIRCQLCEHLIAQYRWLLGNACLVDEIAKYNLLFNTTYCKGHGWTHVILLRDWILSLMTHNQRSDWWIDQWLKLWNTWIRFQLSVRVEKYFQATFLPLISCWVSCNKFLFRLYTWTRSMNRFEILPAAYTVPRTVPSSITGFGARRKALALGTVN